MINELLRNKKTNFILEAHNAVSAQIVEEAGFPGIWLSSLSMSASWGVRDNNELSMSQVLDIVESITQKVTIPVLFDGDTGYGDYNHFQQLVKKLENRNCMAVCIEDKLFPKTNSFINSEKQKLENTEVFCDKIKAGKDCQRNESFCIIARTETLISGGEMDEALHRAHAYADAGADAVLIHSKKDDISEVQTFMSLWDKSAPVVCVPTKYSATNPDLYSELGLSLVIWANHLLRASLYAMQKVATKMYEAIDIPEVERQIASLDEVFRLQGAYDIRNEQPITK
jgi:phosphoenolpyruvate phosphomutase